MLEQTKRDILWLMNHKMLSEEQAICCIFKAIPSQICEDYHWTFKNWKQGEYK